MLKRGEKGTILQNDNKTYAIAPHIPCGIVTPDILRKLADISEKYEAAAMKITGAARIAIVGIKEEDIDNIWKELGMQPGAAVGACIRSIRACPGNTFCKMGKQNALGVGLKLDSIYHGVELPGKCKISVSGCQLNCSEAWVRDIGLIGKLNGWTFVVGGNVGSSPRFAQEVCADISDDQAYEKISRLIDFYKNNATKGERLGKLIDRVGIDMIKGAIG